MHNLSVEIGSLLFSMGFHALAVFSVLHFFGRKNTLAFFIFDRFEFIEISQMGITIGTDSHCSALNLIILYIYHHIDFTDLLVLTGNLEAVFFKHNVIGVPNIEFEAGIYEGSNQLLLVTDALVEIVSSQRIIDFQYIIGVFVIIAEE